MAGNRIRSIRPELLEHPRFAALSDGAVRLWTGLLLCWDDEGRSLGSVAYIAGRVHFARPKTKAVIAREIAELEASGWMKRYQVAGIDYLFVPGWSEPESETYQYIKAPRPSKLPAPISISYPKTSGGPDEKGGNDGGKVWSLDLDKEEEREEERERERERGAPPSRDPAARSTEHAEPKPQAFPPSQGPGIEHRDPKPENAIQPANASPPGESDWHKRRRWWADMLEADRRIRAAGIEPNAPQLLQAPAGEVETNMAICARTLREAGCSDAEVDAKMRHLPLVAEAAAMRTRSRRWFKPALIWDPKRAARDWDTSLAEASTEHVTRAGPFGSAVRAPEQPRKITTLNSKTRSTT